MWDWDGIGDDLVGSTTIDVEDRWFSAQWQRFEKKPVEIRTLHNKCSSFAQGKLELWLEILTDLEHKKEPMIDIAPPTPQPYELRVIVWECKGVTIKDTVTQMNDLYVTGKRTVTHCMLNSNRGHFSLTLTSLDVEPENF